jgi:hypothetical protein
MQSKENSIARSYLVAWKWDSLAARTPLQNGLKQKKAMKAEPKPVPGDIFVRPSRASAECEWPDFYALLESLRGPETLPLRKIAEIAGDTSLNPEANILRKIQNRTLADDARRFILRHIFDDAQLLSGASRKRLVAQGHRGTTMRS